MRLPNLRFGIVMTLSAMIRDGPRRLLVVLGSGLALVNRLCRRRGPCVARLVSVLTSPARGRFFAAQ
jgi:hypothetical protein